MGRSGRLRSEILNVSGAGFTATAQTEGNCLVGPECDQVAVDVKSRIIRSLYATGFGQAVTVLTQLAGVPLFLHYWGVEKYGQWLVLSAIPSLSRHERLRLRKRGSQ